MQNQPHGERQQMRISKKEGSDFVTGNKAKTKYSKESSFFGRFCAVLGQYRIIIVVRLRRQIFRQVVQKFRRHTNVCQEIYVQDNGKDASKRAAKAPAVNCAVLP